MSNYKISVIGLGYVGLPLSVEFGKKYSTVGFDLNSKRIEDLRKGYDKTLELDKDQINKAIHLSFTNEVNDLQDSDIYIVTVPTPVDEKNIPDLNPLKSASKTVGKYLSEGNIVIFESTVYPGATEEVCVPILEKESGLKFNKNFFCGYSPERINPGDKEHTLTRVVKITSGSTIDSSKIIDNLYKSIISAGTHLAPSIKVAEAAKVIENIQRDVNIALMNELSMIFDKLNINTKDILDAAGTKWNFLKFHPGLVGGHCIGVDPYYLTYKAQSIKYNPEMILSGRRINDSMGKFVATKAIKKMKEIGVDPSTSRVGIYGFTFKPNCPDIRNTKVLQIIEELYKYNCKVLVTDPYADKEEAKRDYGVEIQDRIETEEIDFAILAVNHEQYKSLNFENIVRVF
jgi:UDP-N-acetyl-D-galactosamine dehydrogenase